MVMLRSNPFGSSTRTRALIALQMLGDSYARELARLLDAPLSGVQMALKTLERDGIIAARNVGRTRVYQLSPRYFAVRELAAYLARLAEVEIEIRRATNSLRRRPRRTGKPL